MQRTENYEKLLARCIMTARILMSERVQNASNVIGTAVRFKCSFSQVTFATVLSPELCMMIGYRVRRGGPLLVLQYYCVRKQLSCPRGRPVDGLGDIRRPMRVNITKQELHSLSTLFFLTRAIAKVSSHTDCENIW